MIDFDNSKKIYFSIKEVAQHFQVNESLLRYWEKKFDEIKPKKTEGGTRQYTREDVKAIELVFSLVKDKGLTLEGARQILGSSKDEETKRIELLDRLEKIKKDIQSLIKGFE